MTYVNQKTSETPWK